jgi:aspartate-semialdehyde dehydrogenase
VTKINVGVLGATGTVGLELIRRLRNHPWFSLAEVGASEASAGRELEGLVLKPLASDWTSPVLFSALPTSVAAELEPRLADRGHAVVSNASAHRTGADVPLLVPEVNAAHLALLERQGWSGTLVTNPNCAVAGLVVALAPLERTLGIQSAVVTTLQAISGAGRPGPAAGDLLENVIPFIGGEEDKVESEPQRILGTVGDAGIVPAGFSSIATCTRVPVLHGHTVAATVTIGEDAEEGEVLDILTKEQGLLPRPDLPSSPDELLRVWSAGDRPQPRLDRDLGNAMTVSVGRVRVRERSVSLVAMTHNLGRGAAGAALQNAELLYAEGHLGG